MRLLVGLVTVLLFSQPLEARDPFNPTGFPTCAGGEQGYWQFVVRDNPTKGEKPIVSLVLTTVDVPDPAYVVCWVDGRHRIMAMGEEKKI